MLERPDRHPNMLTRRDPSTWSSSTLASQDLVDTCVTLEERKSMKVLKLLSISLPLTILSMVCVASAFGFHEWLEDGQGIVVGPRGSVARGSLLLLGLGIFGVKLHVVCNDELIGGVGPGPDNEITSVVSLSGHKLISCEILSVEKGLCEGTLALVEAELLPWGGELLLFETGKIKDDFHESGLGEPAYDVRCLLSGGSWSLELCRGRVTSDPLVNTTSGVEGNITNQSSEACGNSGNVLHVYAKYTTTLTSGKKLTVN